MVQQYRETREASADRVQFAWAVGEQRSSVTGCRLAVSFSLRLSPILFLSQEFVVAHCGCVLAGRCVRKGMDCTPHIPVRLRKAQAAALGTAFNHAASREQAEALHAASKALNHAASLFSAVPKIEPKMISAPAHSASDEDEEAASALLGLFGGISSDAAAPDDAVAQRHQTCKRRLCDEVR